MAKRGPQYVMLGRVVRHNSPAYMSDELIAEYDPSSAVRAGELARAMGPIQAERDSVTNLRIADEDEPSIFDEYGRVYPHHYDSLGRKDVDERAVIKQKRRTR